MRSTTQPPITQVQNSAPYIRLLAAQRQLYSEAKSGAGTRLMLTLAVALLTILVGAVAANARDYIGGGSGIVLLVFAATNERRERRTNRLAAAVQETFDIGLYQIGWPDFLCDHPTEWEVSEAAGRGSNDQLASWYQPESISSLVRPLDILVCQRANLDYGVALHRAYSRALSTVLGIAAVMAVAISLALDRSVGDLVFAVIAPLVSPGVIVFNQMRAHSDSAESKADAQDRVAQLWRRGLLDPLRVTDQDCRHVQDCILEMRRSHARVPDRFYANRRDGFESTMLMACSAMVEEATSAGHTISPNE